MARQKVKFADTEFEVSSLNYWLIIFVAFILACAVTAALSFYTLKAGESGVVVRLGRFHKVVESGLHWRLPWGIDHIYRLKNTFPYEMEFGFTTVQSDSGATFRQPVPEESRLITGDLYLADVYWTITYRINQPIAYCFNSQEPRQMLHTIAESALRKAAGNHSLQELFQTNRQAVVAEATKYIEDDLQWLEIGIVLQDVALKEVIPVSNLPTQALPTSNLNPQASTVTVDTAQTKVSW